MIWSAVWIEAVVFTALFTAMVMIPTIRHPEIGVHNYPPAGDGAHGQGLRAEVVPREGDALPGVAVSRHHQRAHGPSCHVGQVSKKEKTMSFF